MPEPIFQPLPDKPDHPGLERAMLTRWEEEETFAKLREQNRGGPTFSFMDGPMTANNPAGVHHGHGRTLKKEVRNAVSELQTDLGNEIR